MDRILHSHMPGALPYGEAGQCVTGEINSTDGKPEIILTDPKQLVAKVSARPAQDCALQVGARPGEVAWEWLWARSAPAPSWPPPGLREAAAGPRQTRAIHAPAIAPVQAEPISNAYPYCLFGRGGGSTTCYFRTREECGGGCVNNPA